MPTGLSQQRLSLAGWLSVTNAVLTIPILILSLILAAASQASPSAASGFGARILSALLTLASTAVLVYIFSTLRVLLVEGYSFHETSGLITMLIAVNVVFAAFQVLGVLSPAIETVVSILSMVAMVPLGIIFIVFAIKLLRLPDNLHGMLKPFAYTSIATGFCFATILLSPVGVLTSVASDIFLAIIFFRAMEGAAG